MVLLVRSALTLTLLALTVEHVECREWRWIKPVIDSEVTRLLQPEADVLLSNFCRDKLRSVPKVGLECSVRTRLGERFADIVDDSFHPEGVIYGHFLGPTSDDAAVSGWSAETHPMLWGGTLLLTKRNGTWDPVWYKSSAITHSCRKFGTPTGKDILLCEEEDAGMGAQVHYLYSLDLTKPVDIRDTLLVEARSFNDGCTVRKQEIQRITWATKTRRIDVTLVTPEWRDVSTDACAGNHQQREKRPASVSITSFELVESGFRSLKPSK